jgi:hypothetical protein
MVAPAFFGSEILVNASFTTNYQMWPDLVVLPTGQFSSGWVSYRPPSPPLGSPFDGLTTRLSTQTFTAFGGLAGPAWIQTSNPLPYNAGHGPIAMTPNWVSS